MTTKQATELGQMCNDLSAKLAEHFDAVQIMATMSDEDGTRSWFQGCGNWFARQGLAHEFIGRVTAGLTGKSVAEELHNVE